VKDFDLGAGEALVHHAQQAISDRGETLLA